MLEFKLPSLGAEMDEGTILEWRIEPGKRVKKGDVVAVVDTSKAAIDVEIWQEERCSTCWSAWGKGAGGHRARVAARRRRDSRACRGGAAGVRRRSVRDRAATPAAAGSRRPTREAPTRRAVSPAARKRANELGVDVETLAGPVPATRSP